jgi:hypothetical protein
MDNKGLPLIIMIRYCPLPWAIGNGLFAVSNAIAALSFRADGVFEVCRECQIMAIYVGKLVSSPLLRPFAQAQPC